MKLNLRPFKQQFFLTLCILISFDLSIAYSQSNDLRMSTSGLKSDIEFENSPPQKRIKNTLFPKAKRVSPPFPQFKIKPKAIQLNAQKTRNLRMPSGTKIEIPANAFVDASGKIVTGQVDFYYEEYNSGLDIMLSGIPMDFKGQHFESAAMFDLRAAQNGEPVYPNPEAPIEVLFPATPEGENYSFYNYNEEKGEWNDKGVDELLEAELNLKDMWGDAFDEEENWVDSEEFMNRRGVIRSPVLLPGGLTIQALRPPSGSFRGAKKGLQFRLKYNSKANDQELLVFSEWKKLNNTYWVYAGDQSWQSIRHAKRQMDGLYFENWSKIISKRKLKNNHVMDVWMVADTENDCFNLMIASLNDTLSFPVLPYQNGDNEMQEQKRIRKMFKQYEQRLGTRKADWQEKIADFYLLAGDSLSQRTGGWSFNFTGRNINLGDKANKGRAIPRRVKIKTFGLCNIDTILRLLGEEILVQCFAPNGDSLTIASSYIWNDRPRTALNYQGATIQLPSETGNRMLLKFENGTIATINQQNFQKAYKARKKNIIRLEVVPIEEEEMESTKLAYSEVKR